MNQQDRIAIIGAGPGGLSTAWYLKKKGYQRVTVLEKLGRVGGLARSITEGYKPYDLGANLTTMSYKNVSEVAKEIGAKRFSESAYAALKVSENKAELGNIMEAVLDGNTLMSFSKEMASYVKCRWEVSKYIDQITWKGIGHQSDVMCSFGEWLDKNNMSKLRNFFEIPITTFGYGYLDDIPAIYALKYMNLKTVIPSVISGGLPILKWLLPYPKKFQHGFQRYFEAMSWSLDVRLNIDIERIERIDGKIDIHLTQDRQIMNDIKKSKYVESFDKLIIATPFSEDVLAPMVDLTEDEKSLLSKVKTLGYSMTTMHVKNLGLKQPIAIMRPLTKIGTPWAVVKQWQDNNFTQFYTTVADPYSPDNFESVLSEVKSLIQTMNGTIVNDLEQWSTYDQWPYFQHIDVASMKDHWFDKFESIQGKNNTWYVGAIASFELIEPIFRYSEHTAKRL